MQNERIGLQNVLMPAHTWNDRGWPVECYYNVTPGVRIPDDIHLAWYYEGVYFEDLTRPRQLSLDIQRPPRLSLEVSERR